MDIDAFRGTFQRVFPGRSIFQPEDDLWNPMVMNQRDLCPDVQGMLSLRKQRLLNVAFSTLPEDEAYLEMGTLGAMADSLHDWRLLYHLPARMNGGLGLWWNGVGVLSFRRIHADEGAFI